MNEDRNEIGRRAGANGTSSDTKTDESISPPNKNALMKLKSYLIALRVWSLSASIIPTILGESGRECCATSSLARVVRGSPTNPTQVHGDRELDVVSCDLVHFLNLKFVEDDFFFAALFVLHMITATLLNWFESCRVRSRH